jgi:hypothetical protein
MPTKYERPPAVADAIDQATYVRWLSRIADAHKRRDRLRGNLTATRQSYMQSIHNAVVETNGRDAYTGEVLYWQLISKYDNEASRNGGRKYKALFAMKPTVDHTGDGLGVASFKICAWRTNSAKSDMNYSEFVELCRKVLLHQAKTSTSP